VNWYDGRIASFDTETTGVDPEADRIVTASLVSVGGGEPTVASRWLVNPGIEITEGATAVHGITNEHAREHGQPAPGAIGEIAFGIRRVIREGWPLTVYNAPFDLTMVDRECRRHRIDPPDWSKLYVIDPFVIWKWADRFRRGSRKLTAACECFGVELGAGAHDADLDALAVARLAWRMFHPAEGKPLVQGRHPEIIARRAFWKTIKGSLIALQDAQRGWQAEQAEGLRLHFEGKGEIEKAATVRVGWPLVPYVAEVKA
jgi:DNA polymerase III epsilon subunit-like protein